MDKTVASLLLLGAAFWLLLWMFPKARKRGSQRIRRGLRAWNRWWNRRTERRRKARKSQPLQKLQTTRPRAPQPRQRLQQPAQHSSRKKGWRGGQRYRKTRRRFR